MQWVPQKLGRAESLVRCEEEVEEEGWFTRWQSALHLPLGTWVKACKRAGERCGVGGQCSWSSWDSWSSWSHLPGAQASN